jgi:hypothetical protein
MANTDEDLHVSSGVLIHEDTGHEQPARFYRTDDEAPPPWREFIDSKRYVTWEEHDGAIGIRRGTSVSVGASKTYGAKYDEVEWGN